MDHYSGAEPREKASLLTRAKLLVNQTTIKSNNFLFIKLVLYIIIKLVENLIIYKIIEMVYKNSHSLMFRVLSC